MAENNNDGGDGGLLPLMAEVADLRVQLQEAHARVALLEQQLALSESACRERVDRRETHVQVQQLRQHRQRQLRRRQSKQQQH